ncbi:hypothetical protein C2857_001010 [Epichloe festucae Fl1]|uniref:Aminoglycoside phosphotransferase domain-containing protein n=1 Tax=Epichloe festucae (strain Fl1) TaxID=877507 RepID=A0A7U3SNI5_EPIFF|nr:hypothetical protein C2857_001010 [Epichloe festucae Fl1]
MLSTIWRFVLAQWTWCATGVWTVFLRIFRNDPSYLNPLTPEQYDSLETEYANAIDRDAVCALASSYNNGLPCRVAKTDKGSYNNVCFFVLFYTVDQMWVVRVPIQPAVHNVWEKFKSEVCTMRYVREKTSIPIPQIFATGFSRLLLNNPTKQAFMIIEHIKGQSISMDRLLRSPEEHRKQFYSDLIDILAELRKLEFVTGGSLMPASTEALEPRVVSAFSIPDNTLQINGWSASHSLCTSTAEYIHEQLRLLWNTFLLPAEDLDQATAELELFALNAMNLNMNGITPIASGSKCASFVLTHADLRCPNIIVDEDLHIRAVIDWEWASTVPPEFFTPPSWITNSEDVFPEFVAVLESKRTSSSRHQQLVQQWKYGDEMLLHMGQIFRVPSELLNVFYNFIYPKLFEGSYESVVSDFFRCDENRTCWAELKRRLHSSERYTKYLKANGLYVEDEENQKIKDWLAKAKELRLGQ